MGFKAQVVTEASASGAQVIEGSLRVSDGSSGQYMTRTATSGNRRTWTWSAWLKREQLADKQTFMFAETDDSNQTSFGFNHSGASPASGFYFRTEISGTTVNADINSSLRDCSAWYHVVVACDTIQSAANDRVKVYINGTLQDWDTSPGMGLNADLQINHNVQQQLFAQDGVADLNAKVTQVYLIDGQALTPEYFGFTDPLTNTWRPKKAKTNGPNVGTTWSSVSTISSGGAASGKPLSNGFDGSTGTAFEGDTSGATVTVPVSATIVKGGVKVYAAVTSGNPLVVLLKNGDTTVETINAGASGGQFYSSSTYSGPITSLVISRTGRAPEFNAIGINGIILEDDSTTNLDFGTNGFYLPLDGNTLIGKDQSGNGNDWTPVNFGGSNTIEKATGAFPILNTINGGRVATAGTRDDANASNLVLALPLGDIRDDIHHIVKGSGSAKTVTANGNAAASSDQSNFYGGSYYFDGSTDSLTAASSNDFGMGTGDFTIEAWVYPTTLYSANFIVCLSGSDSVFGYGNDGTLNIQLPASGAPSLTQKGPVIVANKWNHFACVRESGALRAYIDGVLAATVDSATTDMGSSGTATIGDHPSLSREIQGYLQDVRIYKGTAKYTSDFISAATDPDIIPDTPSGVSGGSNLAKSVSGGVAFDGTGDYLQIPNHADLRFGSGAFCVEAFVYYSETSGNGTIAGLWNSGSNRRSWLFQIESDNRRLRGFFSDDGSTVTQVNGSTGQMSRNAWHHVAFTRSGNDFRIFLDGVEVGSATSSNSLFDNSDDDIGVGSAQGGASSDPITGFISDVRIVKGSAVYTSDFTPPAAPLTNITNTKLLCCQSTVSATAADVIPTGSITANGDAAATTFNPFNTDIDAVRGQETGYCTWNPLLKGANTTLSDGNLANTTSGGNTDGWATSTMLIPKTGKYYVEFTAGTMVTNTFYGMYDTSDWSPWTFNGFDNNQGGFYGYQANTGEKYNTGSESYGDAVTLGDTVGALYNADDGTLSFTLNGVSQGVAFSSLDYSGNFKVWFNANNSTATPHKVNFGQKPFKFPPPEGYTILSASTVLSETVIARPDQYFDTKLYTGITESPRTISGLSMTPDMIWVKNRDDDSTGHYLFDTVRGDNNNIRSDGNFTQSAVSGASHGIISTTGKNSFTVKDGSSSGNNVGSTGTDDYVAWCWKAGGNESTFNVDGAGYATAAAAGLSCTADLVGASIGTKQGFSIIRYQATSGETVAHGLTQQPGCIFMKNLDTSGDWNVYHSKGGDGYDMANNEVLNLNNDDPMSASGSNTFITGKNATTFTVGSSSIVQNGSDDFIAYCWHDVPGLQKFGHWKANNSTNGNFLHLGFRPGLIIAKQVSGSGTGKQWFMMDSKRNTTNPINNIVDANRSDNERQATIYDLTSNGAKIRFAFANNEHFIYMAWAETPTSNLYGAQANAR